MRKRMTVGVAAFGVLAISVSAFAQGRPNMQRILMQGSETTLNVSQGGGVAQDGVPAAIYRSTQCGFVSWIGGIPAWLDQAVLFNDANAGAPLRTIATRACFDVCTLGGLCGSCSCMTAADLPFDVTVQMYDGDPCGGGTQVAGANGTATFDESILGTSFGGSFQCFRLNFAVDPKVAIPHEGWIEQIMGADDAWVFVGRPNSIESQGESNLSGLDDGVVCSTFCDIGGASCGNDPDRCDWFVWNLDSNAEVLFSINPVSSDGASNIVDNEIIMAKGGQKVFLETSVTPWTGPNVQAWASGMDSSGYTSGLAGTITACAVPCTSPADCTAAFDNDSPCGASGFCNAAWINKDRADYLFNGQTELSACDVSTLDFRCASTLLFGANIPPPAGDAYLWSMAVEVSAGAAGTFQIDLQLPPANSLLDANNVFIPLVGVTPALITVETGQCCDLTSQPFVCLNDGVTANECAAKGGTYTAGKTCADECGCNADSQCADGDACTIDTCNAESQCVNDKVDMTGFDCCDPDPANGDDLTGGGALTAFAGVQCFADSCTLGGNRGVAIQTPTPGEACDDGEPCVTVNDTCDEAGACVGTDILTVPCTNNATCEALTSGLGSCNNVTGFCRCVPPSLNFDIHPGSKANPNCFDQGDKITVDVYFKDVPVVVTGGQFVVEYDPSCLDFNSISPGGGAFTFEIEEIVDEAAGRIFYAVGVNPFGGVGVIGEAVLATISFTKLDNACGTCGLCFGGNKLMRSILVDDNGQQVQDVELKCSKDIIANEDLTLDTPGDVRTNVDCGSPNAVVTWDAPSASSDCGTPILICGGAHESGKDMSAYAMGGGEHPQGQTTYCCTAITERCGKEAEACWTVSVSDEQSFDLEVQLSPIIAGDICRCIEFELYSDCVTPPTEWEQEMCFGGVWDFVGHATPKKKLPKGQFVAIAARDQNHTLRACAEIVGVGTAHQCSATFKGDPFFGGNWLIGGNLDAWKKDNPKASHDKIDILDFGMFVSQYGAIVDPNTDCATVHDGPHADINGDGVVDALDFTFIMNNFLAHSKDCVCPAGVAGTSEGLTEVSVTQLREWGMPELAVADLNGDGLVNTDDMSAFLAGDTPTQKTKRVRTGSGLGSR